MSRSAPGKAEECGTLRDPVMVSGNDDNSGPRDRREQIVDFLQVAGQRLAVEQIAGDREGDRRGSLSRPQ